MQAKFPNGFCITRLRNKRGAREWYSFLSGRVSPVTLRAHTFRDRGTYKERTETKVRRWRVGQKNVGGETNSAEKKKSFVGGGGGIKTKTSKVYGSLLKERTPQHIRASAILMLFQVLMIPRHGKKVSSWSGEKIRCKKVSASSCRFCFIFRIISRYIGTMYSIK